MLLSMLMHFDFCLLLNESYGQYNVEDKLKITYKTINQGPMGRPTTSSVRSNAASYL